MKADELRRALDDLAGDVPEVDRALGAVTRKARRDRLRNRGVAVTLVACVIAIAAFGVSRRSNPEHVTVRNPPTPPIGNVSGLTWTRVAAPKSGILRVVTANGSTYALGDDNAGAWIAQLAAGKARIVFEVARRGGFVEINDLVRIRGALVAVGTTGGGARAWRSADNGETWHTSTVEQPPPGSYQGEGAPAFSVSISRVVASGGKLYAFGQSIYDSENGRCPRAAWTSTDGAAFELVPASSPIACGGVDATDGPAGLVAVEHGPGVSIVDRTRYPIAGTNGYVAAIASDDHGYVVVGNSGAAASIWWSADGRSWIRVVTASSPDARALGRFMGVVHTRARWIAVGYRTHLPGAADSLNDMILWTSVDGQHWTQDKRDFGSFEQFASADGIGVTDDGVAVFGTNVRAEDTRGNPSATDTVLWLGSSTPAASPAGIIEGTLEEVGGPKPLLRPVAGTVTITAPNGHTMEVPVGPDGWYSVPAVPGTYHPVGHSPAYGSGKYACDSQIVGSDEEGEPVIVRASVVSHVDLLCQVR